MQYWLAKTEPETYSIQMLYNDGKTNWNGVRNFQARNNLRKMSVGDLVLIYHSGDERAVVGIAKVVKAAYPDQSDPDDAGGDWSQVDIGYVDRLNAPVTLAKIKADDKLADMPLIRQSRLSVMPVTPQHYKEILKLAGQK